jgi:hypothetical protein
MPTVAVQGDTPSEPSPASPNLVQSLRPGPLLESLLANLQQHSTTALTLLGAHDLHAALVLDTGVIGTRPAEEISIEVGQVVVVALDALDQIPPAELEATAGTHAALGAGDGGGRPVLTDLA